MSDLLTKLQAELAEAATSVSLYGGRLSDERHPAALRKLIAVVERCERERDKQLLCERDRGRRGGMEEILKLIEETT